MTRWGTGVLIGLCAGSLPGCGRVSYDLLGLGSDASSTHDAAAAPGDGGAGEAGVDLPDGAALVRDGGGPGTDGGAGDGGRVAFAGPCADVLAGDPGAGDGAYTVDPDGAGGMDPIDVVCDMTSDGGGWTLIVNYVHRAGSTPALHVRTDSLPGMASSTLGADESGTASWGHAAPALLATLRFSELRFYCVTSAHDRVLHFASDDTTCVEYAKRGVGGCYGLRSTARRLPDHTAFLPDASTHLMLDQGDMALVGLTFFKAANPKYEWLASPTEWECDGSVGATADTIHRVWIR